MHKQFIAGREKVQALKDVTLEIKESEFFTLLGPSGCGKTTLLRCIAGLETPDMGEIMIGDQVFFSCAPAKVVPPYERNIGMVFQSYAIWPHMNVFNNVAYPLRYAIGQRFTKDEIRKKVLSSLARVHMDGLADRDATQLSGGQQQRVALARALVNDPTVVLLDEPLGNLDAKLREAMRVELRDLLRDLRTTVIYVTHDQAEALSMSDRMAILLDGQVVQVGDPDSIYNSPNTEFVATFVGSSNLLHGFVKHKVSDHSNIIIETKIGLLQIQSEGLDVHRDEEIKIALRPEDVQVSRTMKLGNINTFQGRIQNLQFLGDSIMALVKIADEMLLLKVHRDIKLREGEFVQVLLPAIYCRVLRMSDERAKQRGKTDV